jgi:hypothetical protein
MKGRLFVYYRTGKTDKTREFIVPEIVLFGSGLLMKNYHRLFLLCEHADAALEAAVRLR